MVEEIQILGKADLVKINKVPEMVATMLTKHRNIIGELKEVLSKPIDKPEVKKFMEDRVKDSESIVKALVEGYIPVLVESPINLKTKSKPLKEELDELMVTLPLEAKAALARARILGVFDQFAISGAPRGGDPVIVGAIRNTFFLIATWVNVDGGGAVGFTARRS